MFVGYYGAGSWLYAV